MADEQAKEEVETSKETPKEEAPEEDKEQPSEDESDVSEDANTPEDTDKGDLRVALKEERTKRQDLESRVNDPNFIYQKAQELNMTDEQEAQPEQQPQQQVNQPPADLYGTVKEIQDYRDAVKEFPQAESDADIQAMVGGMVQGGIKPAEAVKKVRAKFDEAVKEIRAEETAKEQEETSAQDQAQTASGETDVNADQEEYEDLVKRSKSLDPVVSKNAHIEILKRRNKAGKVF